MINKEKTRSQNVKINILAGYFAQFGILILSFWGRKVFLNYLSEEYLGINGLFSNVLTVLSVAQLGLDSAVLYSLYEPVAKNDLRQIYSLLKFYKKLYRYIAIVIFSAGIGLVPFLQFIVNSTIDQRDLITYYIMFLINTVLSYFVAYKTALLSAYQEQGIYSIVSLVGNLLLQISYIIVLVIWADYFLYVLALVFSTIITNLTLSIIIKKMHSEIFRQEDIEVDKKVVISRIKATFVYKIGAVLINSTDNILISMLVSTAAVGLYSNYTTVISAASSFIVTITTVLLSSIGSLAAQGGIKRQREVFNSILLFYHYIAALGFIGFSLLFNDLIKIWLGEIYVLSDKIVFIIALNFYLSYAITPVWMFREANGLFAEVKYLILVRAFINIVFSIILGRLLGIMGVLSATAFSLLITNFWIEPKIMAERVFKTTAHFYWINQLKYFFIMCICYCICNALLSHIGFGWLGLIAKIIIICIITTLAYVIFTIKTKEAKDLIGIVFRI